MLYYITWHSVGKVLCKIVNILCLKLSLQFKKLFQEIICISLAIGTYLKIINSKRNKND